MSSQDMRLIYKTLFWKQCTVKKIPKNNDIANYFLTVRDKKSKHKI